MGDTGKRSPDGGRCRVDVGVVLERRETENPWQDCVWRPYAVLPGGGPTGDWRVVDEGPGWKRYYAGRLELELFPGETEGYRENLTGDSPRVFLVLRPGENEHEIEPFMMTACPYEAQDYLDSGEEIVEGLPMPPELVVWVRSFVERHHVDKPFVKRKQKSKKIGQCEEPFSRRPVESGRER
jgi:hypothetical protein